MAKPRRRDQKDSPYKEVTVQIRRVMRVTKGGRQLRFSALVVAGDEKGKVGEGMGKAGEVVEAISKASRMAKKNMIQVPLTKDKSIPHPIRVKYKASQILLMPAAKGTGVIAGSFVRTVCELAGVKNILSKSFGSNNKTTGVRATLKALSSLRKFRPKGFEKKEVKKKVEVSEKKEVKKIDESVSEKV